MYSAEAGISSLQAGIISLKNLSAGILPFATKEPGSRSGKDKVISRGVLLTFRESLNQLLLEIFDPEIAFTEKIT